MLIKKLIISNVIRDNVIPKKLESNVIIAMPKDGAITAIIR